MSLQVSVRCGRLSLLTPEMTFLTAALALTSWMADKAMIPLSTPIQMQA